MVGIGCTLPFPYKFGRAIVFFRLAHTSRQKPRRICCAIVTCGFFFSRPQARGGGGARGEQGRGCCEGPDYEGHEELEAA